MRSLLLFVMLPLFAQGPVTPKLGDYKSEPNKTLPEATMLKIQILEKERNIREEKIQAIRILLMSDIDSQENLLVTKACSEAGFKPGTCKIDTAGASWSITGEKL